MDDVTRLRQAAESGGSQPPARRSTVAAAAASQPPARQTAGTPTPNMYCLDKNHDPRLVTANRLFYFPLDINEAPDCPTCGKKVCAQLAEYDRAGNPMIPLNIQLVADRIGEAV